jgi:hypothetical protein
MVQSTADLRIVVDHHRPFCIISTNFDCCKTTQNISIGTANDLVAM